MYPAPITKAKSNGHGKKKVDVENIEITLDATQLTFGDIRMLNRMEKIGQDNLSPDDFEVIAQFLDRVIVGGIDQYPITAMPQIMEAISKAVQSERITHEKNSKGRRRRSRG